MGCVRRSKTMSHGTTTSRLSAIASAKADSDGVWAQRPATTPRPRSRGKLRPGHGKVASRGLVSRSAKAVEKR